jgi:deoxyribodipyrimidine photo-lyase
VAATWPGDLFQRVDMRMRRRAESCFLRVPLTADTMTEQTASVKKQTQEHSPIAPPATGPMPAALKKLAADPRVTVRRGGEPPADAQCVIYSIALGNELGLPVVAFFSAINNFPHANLRHYHFLSQGLPDAQEDLAERNVSFIVRRPPHNALEKLVVELGAAAVIGDENPMREPERWRQVLAHRIDVPYWTVDADVIVPSNIFPKHFYALQFFRPKLYAAMPEFVEQKSQTHAKHSWKRPHGFESFKVGEDVTEGWGKPFDRSVKPVDAFTGGTHAAQKLLAEFVTTKLADYDTVRNHPERDGTSKISPALHFGHIGPLTIVRAVEGAISKGHATAKARDAFYGEVLAWRELSVNFVKYVPDYDTIHCAPDWAKQTLRKHARDHKPHLYTREELEKHETHDELWNAAQQQMMDHGWMHNYMRMYWAKKILEWSRHAGEAWETCVYLDDKYFLDGRDPNGYSGVAWAIGGVHDRPWFEREIFGTIRYMSGASTGKKFNSKRYIENVRSGRAFGDDEDMKKTPVRRKS